MRVRRFIAKTWKRTSVQAYKRRGFTHPRFYASTLALFLLASLAAAQEEQWLQYRSAVEARQIVGDMGYNYQQPSSQPPENLKMPDFVADKPLFIEMKAPGGLGLGVAGL